MKFLIYFILIIFFSLSSLYADELSEDDLKSLNSLLENLNKDSDNIKKETPVPKKPSQKKDEKNKNVKKESDKKEIKNEKTFVVVIDPGHGGKDPGALNKKIKEKDVVLKLAGIIKKKASNIKGLRVELTRDNDVFLELQKRAEIANSRNGDLFISIHVNANKSKKASGMEVYHLDNRRSEYTDRLALVENRMTENSSMLNTILVDMNMNFYIEDSLKYTALLAKRLNVPLKKHKTKLRDYRKGALFYVLVGARMPSALFEIGFLTNKDEEKKLKDNKYLEDVADAMIKSFTDMKDYIEKVESKHK